MSALDRYTLVGPSADWINPTWSITSDLYVFEDDDGTFSVIRRDEKKYWSGEWDNGDEYLSTLAEGLTAEDALAFIAKQ